jgi:fatty acid-binding protein DegV
MMVDKVESAVGYMGKIKIAYVHAAAVEEAEKIKSLVDKRLNAVETIFSELSPALGVHTGPGTAGLCYYPVNN